MYIPASGYPALWVSDSITNFNHIMVIKEEKDTIKTNKKGQLKKQTSKRATAATLICFQMILNNEAFYDKTCASKSITQLNLRYPKCQIKYRKQKHS